MNASFGAQHPLLHRISAPIFHPETGKATLALVGLLPAMALLADIHRFAVNVPFTWTTGSLFRCSKEP